MIKWQDVFYLLTRDLAYLRTSKSIFCYSMLFYFIIGPHLACRDRLGLHLCGEGHLGCQEGGRLVDLLVVLVQEVVKVGSIEE